MNESATGDHPFPTNSAERKWYGFGRYYAMFPVSFPFDAISGLTDPGDVVLDPFCGRGNSLFCAMAQKRGAVGIDENPLAYLYSAVRCNLDVSEDKVISRLHEIGNKVGRWDGKSRTPFQTKAWSPKVRGFLRAARRELYWRTDDVDRVLMGFIVLHAQDKLSQSGLSNSLPTTIACSPAYAVRWWKGKGLDKPPSIDPVEALADKIKRRYQFGVPDLKNGQAYEGDSRKILKGMDPLGASLLITSPPYRRVADYWNDHWIRLWMLGYPFRKDWSRSARFAGEEEYNQLLMEVFNKAKRHLSENASILVRSDIRSRTSEICKNVLSRVFRDYRMYVRQTQATSVSQSFQSGRGRSRVREVDFLLSRSARAADWARECGFE